MPLYEYSCPKCSQVFETIRPIAKRNDPVICELCSAAMVRGIGTTLVKFKGRGWSAPILKPEPRNR